VFVSIFKRSDEFYHLTIGLHKLKYNQFEVS